MQLWAAQVFPFSATRSICYLRATTAYWVYYNKCQLGSKPALRPVKMFYESSERRQALLISNRPDTVAPFRTPPPAHTPSGHSEHDPH